MPTPFPGMDPYLEHPARWPGFHNWLITYVADDLSPRIRPRYFVTLEERVYLADLLDLVPVREWYLEIHEAATGNVVTQIKLLSPTNKATGKGRAEYLEKRLEILSTRTSLVEIDLLRAGEPMPAQLRDVAPDESALGEYRVLVARGRRRPWADVYSFTIRNRLPEFPVPLLADDQEPLVDLQHLVHTLYDRASYDLRLDYGQPPVPPLADEAAAWADALLRERGLR